MASGRASRRFSRIVESKTCASWPASANVAAHVLLAVLTNVAAGDRDAPGLGVEEAQQETRDGALAGTARARQRDATTRARAAGRRRSEPRAQPSTVSRGDALERDDRDQRARAGAARRDPARQAGGRSARARADLRRGSRRAPARRRAAARRRRRTTSASNASVAIRTRSSVSASCADTATASTPTTVTPATRIVERLAETGDERVAPSETGELAVERANALAASSSSRP